WIRRTMPHRQGRSGAGGERAAEPVAGGVERREGARHHQPYQAQRQACRDHGQIDGEEIEMHHAAARPGNCGTVAARDRLVRTSYGRGNGGRLIAFGAAASTVAVNAPLSAASMLGEYCRWVDTPRSLLSMLGP